MSVSLIDYTGAGRADYAARLLLYAKGTRLGLTLKERIRISSLEYDEMVEELEAVALSVRSSWEFVDYTFQIDGVTRATMDQIVRTRIGSYAVQAQRVTDFSEKPLEVTMPKTVEEADEGAVWKVIIAAIQSAYTTYRQGFGVPSQDCRGLLPMNTKTNGLVKWNLRTLADVAGKRVNLRAQDEYSETCREMCDRVFEVHPWAKPFIFPPRLQTPSLDAILKRIRGDGSPVDNPELNDALKELDRLKGIWG